jgi:hypothetical protein
MLRDFDETIFMKHPLEYLQLEDEMLTLVENTADTFDMGYYNF